MTKLEMEQALKDNVKLVYHVINNLQFIPDGIEHEELEQVGKVALWKGIDSYDDECGCSISTHCCKIIYRDIIDFLRRSMGKKRKGNTTPIDDHPELSIKPFEDSVMGDMLIDEIKKVIPDTVEMFLDKLINGLSLMELAEKYGVTERQVRYQLKKAKGILQNKLKWEDNL